MIEQVGRYEILEEIGEGGFAIVYRARDTELDRLVALKELRPILLNDKDWVKRFRREAKTIARLDHPHIVTIHDVYDMDNRLFIVMRLVDGPSLGELISKREHLPWPEVIQIITGVAEGLEHAHSRDILHRDLKPANILMDQERGPMLTDFGLAKLAGESSMSVTAGGGVVGTPHYIAPEVWEGKGTTRQSDMYALGCILYEMLTGEKVFKGETPPAVMMAHFKPPTFPQVWPEGVPPDIANVLKTALAGNPGDRYDTVGEMAQALTALSSGPVQPTDVTEYLPDTEDIPQPQPVDRVADASSAPAVKKQPAETGLSSQSQEQIEPAQPLVVPSPATPGPFVSETTPVKKKRGSGCLWVSVAVVFGLILLAGVGIGGVCSTVGNLFNSAFSTVELDELVTQNIRVPWPDNPDPPELKIEFFGGQFTLAPGAEEGLMIAGTATYNVTALEPQIVVNDNNVRLFPKDNIGLGGLATPGIRNAWDLRLGSRPMDMSIHIGGAETNIDLGGLALTKLTVEQGAANFDLLFSRPNQIKMDALGFTGGASNATFAGLANAWPDEVTFEGGAGNYTLDFSGELRDDIEVSVSGGLGTIHLIVPEGVAAEVTVDGGMSNVEMEGAWQESDGTYLLAGEGPMISVSVDLGVGTLRLGNE